jgi:hypothetical protein
MAELTTQAEKLLSISVEQYRGLVHHAETLLQTLEECDYKNLAAHTDKLQQLQSEATRHDQTLLPLFNDDPAGWKNHPLYRKRREFIKVILDLNKQLIPRIKATLAVTCAELNKLQDGRTALAGYSVSSSFDRGVCKVG